MKKYILASILLILIIVALFPYFSSSFSNLREKIEREANYQRILKEQLAQKKSEEEAIKKIYLMGKFDPAEREDFAPIPDELNIGGYKMYLRKETLDAFLKMRSEAEKENIDLKIASATRNFIYQKNIWNNKWTGYTLVDGKDLSKSIPDGRERLRKILEYSAAPGTSRHHWGTDIDINNANIEYFNTTTGKNVYAWLTKNASSFGFCQAYNLKGSSRGVGYNEEKWHWSYLPIARNLTQEYKNLIKEEDLKGFNGDEYVKGENIINNYVVSINPDCI